VLSTHHARLRAHQAPGIPCALFVLGRILLAKLARMRGEIVELCR
jgi:hypothetical protein